MAMSSLSTGVSALQAAARRVDVASHNVANAQTEGYTRQRVEVRAASGTAYPNGVVGGGVTLVTVTRLREELSAAAVRNEAGVEGAASARASALGLVERTLGTYGDAAPEALSRFTAAWDELALAPTSTAARQGVLDAGADLAGSIRSAAAGLDDAATALTGQLGDLVGTVSGLAAQVADLDRRVLELRTRGSEPNDLLDARDHALEQLSALTGSRSTLAADGSAVVTLGGATLVAAGAAAPLTAADPAGLLVGGTSVAAGGQVGGVVSVLRADVPALRAQLDAAATGLRDTANALHRAGSGLDGVSGRDVFTGTGAGDLALAALTTDQVAASASGARGDGSAATAMAGLRTAAAVGTSTAGQALTAVGVRAGSLVSAAQRSAASAASGLTAARTAQSATDGVNVDEEMVDLLAAQHSYEAAARVISVADEMMATLLQIGR